MHTEENKKAAVDFLEMIITGKIDEAYDKYVDMDGKHHNIFTPEGLEALKEGMKSAEEKFPLQAEELLSFGILRKISKNQ